MNEIAQRRATIQDTMNFLGALASGVEELVGRPSAAMAYVAGKKLGKKFSAGAEKTSDIEKALGSVRQVLTDNDCLWQFETFQPKDQEELVRESDLGGRELLLVFRDCMIRQSLFRFGHEQKGSLCTMMYGFFAGALEQIMGCQSKLEILHAGENACLKRLVLR